MDVDLGDNSASTRQDAAAEENFTIDEDPPVVVEEEPVVGVVEEPVTAVEFGDDVGASLPSAEEIRSTIVAPPNSNTFELAGLTLKKWQWYAMAGGLALVMIIGLSVGLSGGSSSSPSIDDASASATTPLGYAGVGDVERYRGVVEFLGDFISSKSQLETRGTPQNLAANWMAGLDKDQFTIPYDSMTTDGNYYFIQRYVMVVFYYALGGQNWQYSSRFLTSAQTCDWNRGFDLDNEEEYRFGVHCENREEISYLFMPGNGLRGSIPTELGYLTKLTHISLFGNEIKGTIPDSMQELTNLDFLAMESNMISGEIPDWIGNLHRLKIWALGDNYLTGKLPASINRLSNLVEVALDGNDLTGSVQVFEDLSKLRRLYLGENKFEGTMDNDFFAGSKVKELDLASNQFDGTLPTHFFNDGVLQLLDVHNNKIKGELPSLEAPNLSLKFFSAFENQLTSVADALADLKALEHLDLSANKITGEDMPDGSLGDLTNLKYLFLSNNDWNAGPVPESYGLLTNLEELSLQSTHRTGILPHYIPSNLTGLVLLDLGKNALTGTLPNHMKQMTDLQFLLLNQNQFSGTIKKNFADLSTLRMFLADQNDLTGGAEHICNSQKMNQLEAFATDCPGKLDCECCQQYCCSNIVNDNDGACYDDTELVANFDMDWVQSFSMDSGYQRDDYVFSENLIFRPMTEDKDL